MDAISSGDTNTLLEYYKLHSPITDPGGFSTLYSTLPGTVPGIVDAIHGLLMHFFWADVYRVNLTELQKEHINSRHVFKILEVICNIDNSQLECKRPSGMRFMGNCRDHAVFLCSILRSKGIPARARCGFVKYFNTGRFDDHWICEYWNGQYGRWVRVDAQLDDVQKQALSISFDTLDIPPTEFLSGADVWLLCRRGAENPDCFSESHKNGFSSIRGNLIRDLACLNKMELLQWDCWGLILKEENELSQEDLNLLDNIACMIASGNEDPYEEYRKNRLLKVPDRIWSFPESGPKRVKIL